MDRRRHVERKRLAPLLGAVVAALALAAPAAAAPPPNDSAQQAATLAVPGSAGVNTTEASFAAELSGSCDNRALNRTVWYAVRGTGGRLTVNTRGSDFDTAIVVHNAAGTGFACNDDIHFVVGGESNDLDSEVDFPTLAGRDYYVQIGGIGGAAGTLAVETLGPPGNDELLSATPLALGQPFQGSNAGATTVPGEDVVCEADGNAPLGKTVWLRFTAPRAGTVTVQVSGQGFDAVIALYTAAGAQLRCNDDGRSGQYGPARISAPVPAGDYLLQAGGYAGPSRANLVGATRNYGTYDVTADFAAIDADGDGVASPSDCNDGNPNIRPGARDVTNGVDDDCDGVVDPDRDGDGFPRPADCNDNNRSIRPGAREIPGNRIDENCDGRRADFARLAFRRSVNFDVYRTYTRISRAIVRSVPRGARLSVRCSGRRCPRRTLVNTRYSRTRARVTLTRTLRRHRLRPRTVVEFRLTAPRRIGRVLRYTIRNRRRPGEPREYCVRPGSSRATRC